jgi:hypothetical protein
MTKSVVFCFLLPCVVFLAGCGGSTASAPVAEQDEIAKYAAENPETSKPNTEGIK